MPFAPTVHLSDGQSGGDVLVVETGGKILPGTLVQPALSDLTAITGGDAPTEAEHNAVRTAINAINAALRGIGVSS